MKIVVVVKHTVHTDTNTNTHTHTHTQGAASARRTAPANLLVARREVLGPENVAVPATTNVTRMTKASKPAIVSS